MAKLVFHVQADYEEVIRLRNEIEKLKKELKGMDATQSPVAFNTLNTQLSASTKRMDELVTEAAKAGAVMEQGFKRKIFDAAQTVNGFTEKIIAQKAVVKDVEADVRRLGEAYRNAKKNNPWGADAHLTEYNAARRVLDEEKAALFALTQEQANARLSVKRLRDEYALYRKDGSENVDVTEQMKAAMLDMGKKVLGGIGIKEFIGQMIKVRGEFQAADTAIQTLLGSKEKADALMSKVREYAKISPLEFSDVTQATQMMLGFNIEAEKVPRFLQAIGDVSMGETQKFNSLTLAFSQMSAAGKLMGQDLNQMIGQGFNPLQIMSEKTGKSIAQLKDEMSKGAISAEMVQQAFIDATSAGGKFYKMSENASKTINGQLSMMQDAMDAAFNEMGQASEGFIISGIQMTTKLIENYETVGKVLAGLVITYGTYKAALITNIALTQSWAAAAKADAVAKGIQAAATKAATIAQASFNAVANANPYVLLTTTIVGLGTALWAFTKNTNQAEEAQKRLDEATGNMRKEIASEQVDIDMLFNDLKNAKKGTDEYAQAKDAILNKYGKYLDGLNEEIRTLKNVKGAYDAITVAATKAARARGMETAMRGAQEAYGEFYSDSAGKLYDNLREAVGDTKATSLLNRLKAEINNTGKASKTLREEIASLFTGTSTYGRSKAWITGMENATRTLKDETKKIKAVFGDVEEPKEGKKDKKKTTTYQEDLNNAKTEWNNAKKELTKIEKDKSKFTSKQYEDAKKRKETAEKAYKDLGGIISTSSTSRTGGTPKKDNRLEAEKKANEELLKLQQENQQAQLDLEEDTTEKKLKLIDLSYDKQKAEIEKKERELAEQNKKAGTTGLNKKGLTAEQQTEINKANEINDKSREKQIADVYKAELTAMRDYLKEYGTFQQQKLAIAEEYAEKIAKAQTEGERKALEKERDKSIQSLSDKQLLDKVDWVTTFGKLGTAFEDIIKNALDEINAYINTDDFKKRDADEKQAILEARDKLQGGTSNDATFAKLNKQIEAYRQHLAVQTALEKAHTQASKTLLNAEQARDKITNKSSKEYEEANKKVITAKVEEERIAELLTTADNAVAEAQNNVADTASLLQTNLDNFSDGLNHLTSGSLQNTVDGLTKTLNSLGLNTDWIDTFKDTLKKGLSFLFGEQAGGMLADSLDILQGILTGDLPAAIISGISNMLTIIIEGITKGGIIMKPLEALVGGLKDIGNALTFGGVNSWFGGADYSKYNDALEYWGGRLEIWGEAVDKYTQEISKGYGGQSYEAAKQAEYYLNRQMAGQMDILNARLGSGASKGSHSLGYRMWEGSYESSLGRTWSDVAGEIGISSMSDLYGKSADELRQIKADYSDLWVVMDGEFREGLEELIEMKDQAKEIEDALTEALTGVSFEGFRDGFLSTLSDMSKGWTDMVDDFEDKLRTSILNSLLAKHFDARIKQLYTRWSDVFDDQGNVDKNKAEAVRAEQEQLAKDMAAARDYWAEAIGLNGSETISSQQSTTNAMSSLTEDTGKAIEGRVTALQIAGEEIKAQNISQSQSLNILSMKADALLAVDTNIKNIFDDTRDIIAKSYIELVQISENTENSAKFLKDIKADIAEVRINTSRI